MKEKKKITLQAMRHGKTRGISSLIVKKNREFKLAFVRLTTF